MVRSYLAVAGVTVATIGLSGTLMNCGGSTVANNGGGTTTSSTTTAGGTHAEPPGAPTTMTPGDGTGSVTFAISKLFLGDTDWNGVASKTAWENFGYDLDHDISTATSTNLCKPADGASKANVYPDGTNGIDNSFGKLILPIITSLSSSASSSINADITGGKFTIMLSMEKLGSSASYDPLVTQLFAGGDLGSAPKFDGTDMWPVLSSFLNDGMTIASGSKVQFPTSYVNNNVWVSGGMGNVALNLTVSGYTLTLTIANAVITLDMDSGHQHGTQGIIAGVLNTQQLTSQIQQVAGSFDSSLCSGQTIDSILEEIAQASDIMADGTQDPTQTCNGISIGLGFNAELVQIGPVQQPGPGKPNPCSDAGTGGSAADGG